MIDLPTDENPVTVVEGDCLELLGELPEIGAVVTDPPYLTADAKVSMNCPGGVGFRSADSTSVGLPWGYSLDWVDECARLKPKQWFVFANFKMLGGLVTALERHAEVSAVFVWRKSNAPNMTRPVPRMDCEFVVWARAHGAKCDRMGEFRSLVLDVPMPQAGCFATERILAKGSGKAAHPCQKPIDVVRPFIKRIDAELILDPFAGSGTTGVAAALEGRRCILIEKDAKYAQLCRERVAKVMDAGLFADVA